ncbi:MAG: hypothetical protein PHW46_03310 [Candidatus Omnitrophica bacterium]|nr:hypothetical protein [Candidatus Omnitrophota bacterium]
MNKTKNKLKHIYDLMEGYYGDLSWWPADSPFEVIVGAILTQNTSWGNVEKAIMELKKNNALTVRKIGNMDETALAGLIRSSGYHRVKAGRLKNICRFILEECGGRLEALKKERQGVLRKKLLSVKGVGPETCDSILLYALDKPVFVVDAYTKRIFSRHGIINEDVAYDDVQHLVHENFPLRVKKLNKLHACIVETAKRFCKKKMGLCKNCPLGKIKKN